MSDHLNSRLNDLLDLEAEVESREVEVKNRSSQPQPAPQEKFGLATIETSEVEVLPLTNEQDISDQALARASIRNVLLQGNSNLEALLMLAKASEHPRAFEVAATLAKTIVDAATKLDDLASDKNKGTKGAGGTDNSVTNNNTVVMSTEAAMKMLRAAQDTINGKVIDSE